MIGFKICDVPRIVCASPGYIARHQAVNHPQDLLSHNALFYQLYDVLYDRWEFVETKTGEVSKLKPSGNRAANDGDLVRRWCLAGEGIALKSCIDVSNNF